MNTRIPVGCVVSIAVGLISGPAFGIGGGSHESVTEEAIRGLGNDEDDCLEDWLDEIIPMSSQPDEDGPAWYSSDDTQVLHCMRRGPADVEVLWYRNGRWQQWVDSSTEDGQAEAAGKFENLVKLFTEYLAYWFCDDDACVAGRGSTDIADAANVLGYLMHAVQDCPNHQSQRNGVGSVWITLEEHGCSTNSTSRPYAIPAGAIDAREVARQCYTPLVNSLPYGWCDAFPRHCTAGTSGMSVRDGAILMSQVALERVQDEAWRLCNQVAADRYDAFLKAPKTRPGTYLRSRFSMSSSRVNAHFCPADHSCMYYMTDVYRECMSDMYFHEVEYMRDNHHGHWRFVGKPLSSCLPEVGIDILPNPGKGESTLSAPASIEEG